MLYPGSVGLLQKAMRPMLQQGQAKLIEEVGKEAYLVSHIEYNKCTHSIIFVPLCHSLTAKETSWWPATVMRLTQCLWIEGEMGDRMARLW